MLPIISLNGRLIQAGESCLSPLDRGFTLGDGLFETVKVANGTAWYLDHHLARLADGAARLGLVVPSRLRQWIDDVIQEASIEEQTEQVLRITLTRGVALTHGLAGHVEEPPTVVIAIFEKPPLPPDLYERGVSVHVATSVRRNERAVTAGLKTTSYLESVLLLRAANAAGYDDAICLDSRGFVTEASTSNVFLWRNRVLMTPPLTCGILPGITRAVILELAAQTGIATAEHEITHQELYRAEEVFLTSSIRGIVPVTRVDKIPVGLGVLGRMTRQMMAWYQSAEERV